MDNQEQQIKRIVQEMKPKIIAISDYIFSNPELGDQEYKAVKYLTQILKDAGFKIQCPYKNLPTAFRAELGSDEGSKIAFLAEYDALPGYGPDKKPAHACGHNWIAATTVGAALVLAQVRDKLKGKIVVIGTPAEETAGRKIDLAKAGAFADIDAAFQMHLYENSNLKSRALAMDSVEFEFIGKASHAAVYPEDGVNALDAVNLTFTGISYLRQQLKSDVRIHGIITEGGQAPNIIPDRCKCLFYVRAEKKKYFQEVFERVKNCARGAALMTGAKLNINQYENAFDDLINNPVLEEITQKYMEIAGFEPLSKEEEIPGSTDIGNVSYCCPTLYGNVGIADGKAKVHEEEFLKHVNGEMAKERILMTVETFANSAIELYDNPPLIKKVRQSFEDAINK